MRKIGIACFTEPGRALAGRLEAGFGASCEILQYEKGLKEWCASCFAEAEALIFIGAAGIAVRTIAPFLKNKTEDPAVLVMDEAGQYVISLLSGHIGGANQLAWEVAALTGAAPVITTASDVRGKIAVDVFAKENGLAIAGMKAAKEVEAAILRGDPVGFFCSGKVKGRLPSELQPVRSSEAGCAGRPDRAEKIRSKADESVRRWPYLIWVSERFMTDAERARYLTDERAVVLHLIPRVVSLGVGCRREKEASVVEQTVRRALALARIPEQALSGAASIDLKQDEKGILQLCELLQIPFETYSASRLAGVEGTFQASEFVKKTTGVDNVCERSALALAGEGGRLLAGKYAENGVTAALAVREWSVHFGK